MGLCRRFQFPLAAKLSLNEPARLSRRPGCPPARERNLPGGGELSAHSAVSGGTRHADKSTIVIVPGSRFAPMQSRRGVLQRWSDRAASVDAELTLAAAVLGAALAIGLATASDYGLSVDEFNTDDYGPKALAWYTSGFTDRSHFESVEFSLWYYGPWFQMLTAWVQSFDLANRITIRHGMTFLVGLAGVAALLPIGRLAVGRGAGLTAVTLCLMTGYLYGRLFFTPIDVP